MKDSDLAAMRAVINGDLDALNKAILDGADVNAATMEDGGSALHVAAGYDRVDFIGPLVSAGANVNAQDEDGWTALHVAAINGQFDCLALLLSQPNTNLEIPSTREFSKPDDPIHPPGSTARDVAEKEGYTEIVAAIDEVTQARALLATGTHSRQRSAL